MKYLTKYIAEQSLGMDAKFLIMIIVAFVACPLLCYLIVSIVGRLSLNMVSRSFGDHFQLIYGGAGSTIQEFADIIMAFVAGHNVSEARPQMVENWKRGLGIQDIDHDWKSDGVVQDMFDFLIGVAPFYVISFIVVGIQWLFGGNGMPSIASYKLTSLTPIIHSAIGGAFSGHLILFPVFLILVIMLTSCGYSQPHGSIISAVQGVIPWMLLVAIVAVLLAAVGLATGGLVYADTAVVWTVFLSVRAIVYVVVSMIITGIFMILNRVA